MEKLRNIVIILLGISFFMVGCHTQAKKMDSIAVKKIERTNKVKNKIYSTDITKVTVNDKGNFIIDGKTQAPNKSQIVVQPVGNKNAIDTDVSSKVNDENDWAFVNKGKFSVEVSAEKLSDSYTYKVGQIFPVKIIAVSGIKLKDSDLSETIIKQIEKKKIKVYQLIANKQVVSKWNPIFKKEKLDDDVNDLELDIEDNFKDYSVSDDDIKVILVNDNKEIQVDVKVPSRYLLMPPGQAGYMVPVLKAVKDSDLDPTIQYINIDIYGDKENKADKFSISKIKETNFKDVDKLNNEQLENFINSMIEL